MPFSATWVQVQIIILNEVSQKEKEKCHRISLIGNKEVLNVTQMNQYTK